MTMRLAVIVVSYNVCDLLRRCLQSVFTSAAGSTDRLAVEVMVVDNASHDGSAAMIAAEFPAVRLLALAENSGFTGGNNLALYALGLPVPPPAAGSVLPVPAASPPDFVLLLNPDAEVVGDALLTMADFLQANPAAAACGARLQYGDGTFQHGAFGLPTLAQVALDLFPPVGLPGAHRLLDSRLNGRYPQAAWAAGQPFPVDFVLGAAMMVRAAAIRQVGGLDDGYWMYCEEMDWCLRLQDAGWAIYAVPAAQVIHHEGRSSRQVRWRAFERLWRSRFRFYSLHGRRYASAHRLAVRALLRVYLRRQAGQVRAAFGRGQLTGVEAAEALGAFDAVGRL